MVQPSLTTYVLAQLQRGYPPEAIRTALIQAGYSPSDVDFALRIATRGTRRVEISGRNLALVIGGILAVIIAVFFAFLFFSSGPKDISLAVRVDQPIVFPGESVPISVTLTSPQGRTVPVSLDYLITDSSRRTVTSRSERMNVGASAFTSKDIALPEKLAAGDYEVRVVAKFEGLTRVQTGKFTVQHPAVAVILPEETPVSIEEEPSAVECPISCDDLNPATADSCMRGSCVHTFIPGACGNNQCETGESTLNCPEDCGANQDKNDVIAQALNVAKSNPEKAATLCSSLVLPDDADPCFSAIANASTKSALCSSVQNTNRRDNCLMEFAFSGDYTVCDSLSNRYLLTSCKSLSRLTSFTSEQTAAEQEAEQIAEEIQ